MKKTKSIISLLLQAFLLLVFFYAIIYSDLVIYGAKQGKGQVSILLNTDIIEKVLADSVLTPSEKEKINLIISIKQFSVDSLSYKASGSYTTFYNQHNTPSLWVVTASECYSLKPYNWEFPYLGMVSYKGFFDYLSAVKLYESLVQQGYDVELGTVSAWSTLGWFSDPILSSMIRKPKGRLSNLIFHELFHNTYYAKSSVEVNENLANFIGHKATLIFLRNDSIELNKYLRTRFDDSLYTAYMLKSSRMLDSLYNSMNNLALTKKAQLKKNALLDIYNGSSRLNLYYPNRYAEANKEILISKNAYFLDYKRYDELYDSLNILLHNTYKDNLKLMVEDLKKRN